MSGRGSPRYLTPTGSVKGTNKRPMRQIEDYARWILSDPSLHGRLSETELKHARRSVGHKALILSQVP